MKKIIWGAAAFALLFLVLPQTGQAQTAVDRVSGRILLQVQSHGEAWYVYPGDKLRVYMGRPIDAFRVTTNLSLGINNRDFDSFGGVAPRRLAGRILLKVEDLGKAYYVNPVDLRMHFLGRPDDAFRVMRTLGLGITTADINEIPVSGASAIPPGGVLNILVSSPAHSGEIGLPLVVQGQARVFENTLNVRLRDANGRELVEVFTTAQSPDIGQFGPFEVSTAYPQPVTATGWLEVFSISPKDGKEINKIVLAVRFSQVDSMVVKAFFSNSKNDPGSLHCGLTYPVERRIPRTVAVGAAALNELLKGPTVTEQRRGFFTGINNGTRSQSLNISAGVAQADFNSLLTLQVGGACRVSAIRSQIESTLKQFATVNSVVISVNGQTAGVLEP